MRTRPGENIKDVFLLTIFGMTKYTGSHPSLRRAYISHADSIIGGRMKILVVAIMLMAGNVWAYSDVQIADAIYRAEGGSKTSHPYGILAHYKTTSARQACLNTIAHARKDWNGQGDFISFLGSRYCPVGCDTDNGTNQYWIKNVRYFLSKNDTK